MILDCPSAWPRVDLPAPFGPISTWPSRFIFKLTPCKYLHSYTQKSIPYQLRWWDFCPPAYVFLRSAQQVRRPTQVSWWTDCRQRIAAKILPTIRESAVLYNCWNKFPEIMECKKNNFPGNASFCHSCFYSLCSCQFSALIALLSYFPPIILHFS